MQTGHLPSGSYTEGQASCLSKLPVPLASGSRAVREQGLGGLGCPTHFPGHGSPRHPRLRAPLDPITSSGLLSS